MAFARTKFHDEVQLLKIYTEMNEMVVCAAPFRSTALEFTAITEKVAVFWRMRDPEVSEAMSRRCSEIEPLGCETPT